MAPLRRAFWLKQLHQWHWISSAICLVGMLLFAATGFTLNHAGQINAKPTVEQRKGKLSAAALKLVAAGPQDGKGAASAAVTQALREAISVDVSGREAEWSEDEVYVALPRPGGDAFLTIDRASGDMEYEVTRRGAVSYLNDLHKGRNTGTVWAWFLDVFAGGCLVFCITGLFLLHFHAGARLLTWPLVGLGLVVPLLLALLFIHA